MRPTRQQRAVQQLTDSNLTDQIGRFTEMQASDRNWHPTSVEAQQIRALRTEADRREITVPEWMRSATDYEDHLAELPASVKAKCVECKIVHDIDDLMELDNRLLCMACIEELNAPEY